MMKKNIKSRYYMYIAIFFLVYTTLVMGYFAENYYNYKERFYSEIDNNLLIGANSLKHLLATDFHDRAIDKEAITYEEELKNREVFNEFVNENGFAWVYTLVEKDNEFYFSAPTVTEEEAKEKQRWYFLEYEEIPLKFKTAYYENKMKYAEYEDKWGKFRSVAKPQFSPSGRKYLACVDYNISYLKSKLFGRLIYNIFAVIIFILLGFIFLWIYRIYTRAICELEATMDRSEKKYYEEQKKTKILEEIKGFYQKQAMNDQMTGVLNKGYFFEKMKEEIQLTNEKEIKLSVMMIDIDDFKVINDENGHLFGDEVIKVIAKLLKENSRKTDIIGRYGGDEFIVLLPGTSLEISLAIGKRVCEAVNKSIFRNEKRKFSPSVSIGATEYFLGEDIDEVLDRADHYLYVAKYKDKNRVEGGKRKI
jgi:diguanylate cyclase (GGDEF)-like protein